MKYFGEKVGDSGKNKTLTLIFYLLFALSGSAGLIYEVVWVRQFTHLLGASTYAVTIILSTFMGGVGTGGMADRKES